MSTQNFIALSILCFYRIPYQHLLISVFSSETRNEDVTRQSQRTSQKPVSEITGRVHEGKNKLHLCEQLHDTFYTLLRNVIYSVTEHCVYFAGNFQVKYCNDQCISRTVPPCPYIACQGQGVFSPPYLTASVVKSRLTCYM